MAHDMMRAAMVDQPGPPKVLNVRDVPRPSPQPGEVLLEVACCGLNPLDVMARQGAAAWMVSTWPFIPGIEHSGRVVALGKGVDPSWLGKRVVTRSTFGGNAEFSVVPASDLSELPAGMDWVTGAAYRGASHTAWHLLNTVGRARGGQSLLVHSAAGAVGLMLTQVAKSIGLTVIGLVGSAEKARAAAPFGADCLIDYSSADWPTRVQSAVKGLGVDLIIDGNGGAASAANLDLLAQMGQVVFIGATSGTRAEPVQVGRLIQLSASVSGFSLGTAEKYADPDGAISRSIGALVQDGSLRVPVSATLPLADIAEAHRRFEDREVFGRLVIVIKDEL